MRHRPLRALLTAATLSIAGCASWVAPLSEHRLDEDHGHRTLGARIEDESIEYKALVNLARQSSSTDDRCISVISWNGQVLLAGKVADDASRDLAARTVASLRHVQQVHNELTIGSCTGWLARLSDGLLTTRVKCRLLMAADVPARRVKVVTENGTIYLMGLLSRSEAEQVVQVAQEAWGVQKIVKIFEYTDA